MTRFTCASICCAEARTLVRGGRHPSSASVGSQGFHKQGKRLTSRAKAHSHAKRTDAIAEDFVGLFERYILGSSPGHAGTGLIDRAATDSLDDAAAVLAALREIAPKAILVAFDRSLAKVTAERLHALDGATDPVATPGFDADESGKPSG